MHGSGAQSGPVDQLVQRDLPHLEEQLQTMVHLSKSMFGHGVVLRMARAKLEGLPELSWL